MTVEMAGIAVDASIPDQVVDEIVQALQRRQGETDIANVRDMAEREWARYDDARVRTFISVLVRRAVHDQVLGARGPSDVMPHRL